MSKKICRDGAAFSSRRVPDGTPLTMGAAVNEGEVSEYLDGTVDDVRLYSRNLAPCEVVEAMK